MIAKLLLPFDNFAGNLLWPLGVQAHRKNEIWEATRALTTIGYFASPFPEGDGVTFDTPSNHTPEQTLADFQKAFPWLTIVIGNNPAYPTVL